MLIAEKLKFGGEVMPHHQLDFTLGSGEILLVQGRSGIGKTTLLHIISGFADAVSGGLIWQEGEHLLNLRPLPPWERPVSFLFQHNQFFSHLDCDTHLRLAFRPSGSINGTERTQIDQTLKRLGISGLESRMPDALSRGQA